MKLSTRAADSRADFSGSSAARTHPTPRVTELIARARTLGIDAHLVDAESFDELFSDLLRFLPQTADKLASLTSTARPRLATATLRPSTAVVPAIRMNALAVTSGPALCRIVDCTIGGDKEIEEAIANVGIDTIAHRTRDGVLAFGRDNDTRKAFEPLASRPSTTMTLATIAATRTPEVTVWAGPGQCRAKYRCDDLFRPEFHSADLFLS